MSGRKSRDERMRVLHESHFEREIGDQAPEDVDVHHEEWEQERIHEERGNEPDEKQEDDEQRAFLLCGADARNLPK